MNKKFFFLLVMLISNHAFIQTDERKNSPLHEFKKQVTTEWQKWSDLSEKSEEEQVRQFIGEFLASQVPQDNRDSFFKEFNNPNSELYKSVQMELQNPNSDLSAVKNQIISSRFFIYELMLPVLTHYKPINNIQTAFIELKVSLNINGQKVDTIENLALSCDKVLPSLKKYHEKMEQQEALAQIMQQKKHSN